MAGRPRVLVVGGNLAGLRCAQGLPARDFAVTVVDPGDHVEWLPGIHELVSGRRRPDELRLPRSSLVASAGHQHRKARVLRLDAAEGRALLDDGGALAFDYCVIAAGGVNAAHGVPGVEAHAHAFKSVADCAGIGDALRRLPAFGARVTLVGAGIEGVEAIGELLPALRDRRITLALIDPGNGFLGGRHAALDRRIRRQLAGLPIELHFCRRVRAVRPTAIALDDGRELASDLCIWTGGVAPPSWLRDSGLAGPDGWLPVEDTLRVRGQARVFGAGDIVQFARPLPRQAYHAIDMGAHAAASVARCASGLAPRPFRPSAKPQLVSFGSADCFLVGEGAVVASPLLNLGKDLVRVAGLALAGRQADPGTVLAMARRVAPSFARDALGLAGPSRLLPGLLESRLLS